MCPNAYDDRELLSNGQTLHKKTKIETWLRAYSHISRLKEDQG